MKKRLRLVLLCCALLTTAAWAVPIPVPQSPATKTYGYTAGAIDDTDGAQCALSTRQINSGPRTIVATCADNAAGVLYFSADMPKSYTGGTVVMELLAEHEVASPSGNLVMDVSCMCRGPGATINSTWGTAQAVTLTFATQYVVVSGETAAITCDGTCGRGTRMFLRAVVDAINTTTGTITSLFILGPRVRFPVDSFTD